MAEVGNNIYWVGVNDRETDLFEALWPLPRGVSYNSYLIRDEQVALIDSVKGSYAGDLMENIRSYTPLSDIDYVIINHMEPDHSGSVPFLYEKIPNATFIGTEKTKELLASFYGIEDRFKSVSTGASLELGERKLNFVEIPFVHWPETMVCYEAVEGILFSGDAFGGFGTLNGGIFDCEADVEEYEDEILRYFSNIVGSYTAPVKAALSKLEDLEIDVVAPAHGLVWRENPEHIIDLYRTWANMRGQRGVTLVFGSMYGNTASVTEAVARGIKSVENCQLRVLDASRVHDSYLISEVWRREGVAFGAPTYNGGLFPPMNQFLNLIKDKRLKNRTFGLFGSYGWAGGSIDRMREIGEELDWKLVEPVIEFGGKPTGSDLEKAEQMGKNLAKQVISER
ncbi:MAG: FprA family A-type flavoprotein [Candidatus Acetothermia bacterium]